MRSKAGSGYLPCAISPPAKSWSGITTYTTTKNLPPATVARKIAAALCTPRYGSRRCAAALRQNGVGHRYEPTRHGPRVANKTQQPPTQTQCVFIKEHVS